MTAATMVSEEKVPWKDVLASIEFKRMAKTKTGLRPLPPSYAVTDYVATYPEHWAVVSGTAATDGPRLQRQAHRRPDCPENHLQSSSKRVKVKVKDPKLDVTVQTGLYAAEMFAANVAVKHVLEIIVVGLLFSPLSNGSTLTMAFVDSFIWVWYYDREEAVKGHVPQLLWAHKFENPTSAVLKALGVPEAEKDSHMLYIFVSRKLLPITALEGEELFNVWRHIDLWKGGVRHRDVSPPNMMFHKTDKGVLIGVLNDFNLSSLATRLDPHGNERTGTVPFIAPDLLSLRVDEAKSNTYIVRMSSFSSGFLSGFAYVTGRSSPTTGDSPLDAWATTGPAGCGEKKLWFLNHLLDFKPSGMGPRI
ncbi:uncharacterized protein EDB91DRAFT_1244635 [Suillus paluster]|uniref:uncharacterized protein n=1 Tax=Suillus paluster TaxID=48578 RepID=UPI001B862775|nr:uncharacterized protein EDB91DRAFT_1244635 [Suillus paluster]KAG1750042.1 hypothetical protein EDB91DRAFT_1244635 [Suillus paluster]